LKNEADSGSSSEERAVLSKRCWEKGCQVLGLADRRLQPLHKKKGETDFLFDRKGEREEIED